MKAFAKMFTVAAIGVLVAGSASAAKIVVGGKDFTEQLLLTEMTSQLLKAKGFDVDKKTDMGSTTVRDAQVNGQIDLYWEYTGTSLVTYNKMDSAGMDAQQTYDKVKELDAKLGLTWLNPSQANDTYGLAVRADDAKTNDLKSLSDMAAAYNDGKDLVMALGAEFSKRPDGLPGIEKAYGFKTTRDNIAAMQDALTYAALKDDKVDIAEVFTTDGRIKAFNFRVLADDKQFFPNYAIVPVIRTETLKANPELEGILNGLSAKITDEVMQRLNASVDVDKKSVEEVAKGFLDETGMTM
jgi:osmoprotectant transport system substrate-binding protein